MLRLRMANRRLGELELLVAGDAVALQEPTESCQWTEVENPGSMRILVRSPICAEKNWSAKSGSRPMPNRRVTDREPAPGETRVFGAGYVLCGNSAPLASGYF